MPKVIRMLAEKLEPHVSLHGVLVQIFGLGTLIIGESAIGKSEAALDLVLRGHKLIADDSSCSKRARADITGRATDMGKDLLQIRGLGIINIRALYGESATIGSCRIGLVVELEEWKKGQHYSLVGLRERRYKLLAVNLPYLEAAGQNGTEHCDAYRSCSQEPDAQKPRHLYRAGPAAKAYEKACGMNKGG